MSLLKGLENAMLVGSRNTGSGVPYGYPEIVFRRGYLNTDFTRLCVFNGIANQV
jgi:hypothetical protein